MCVCVFVEHFGIGCSAADRACSIRPVLTIGPLRDDCVTLCKSLSGQSLELLRSTTHVKLLCADVR